MENDDIQLSNEVLNSIIDRKRGLEEKDESENNQHVVSAKVKIDKKSTRSCKGNKTSAKLIDAPIQENQQVSAADFVENAPLVNIRQLGNEVLGDSVAKTTRMKDIAEAWASTVEGKRQSKTRMESVKVKGVGKVNVLTSNKYSLEAGEPSVFDVESKGKNNDWAKDVKRKAQVCAISK